MIEGPLTIVSEAGSLRTPSTEKSVNGGWFDCTQLGQHGVGGPIGLRRQFLGEGVEQLLGPGGGLSRWCTHRNRYRFASFLGGDQKRQ